MVSSVTPTLAPSSSWRALTIRCFTVSLALGLVVGIADILATLASSAATASLWALIPAAALRLAVYGLAVGLPLGGLAVVVVSVLRRLRRWHSLTVAAATPVGLAAGLATLAGEIVVANQFSRAALSVWVASALAALAIGVVTGLGCYLLLRAAGESRTALGSAAGRGLDLAAVALVVLSVATVALGRALPPGPPKGPAAASAAEASAPNVVLITIDSVRADHIGSYGYARPTPNLDRLAARGTRFSSARSQAPWTMPSFAALFTSIYPSAMGISVASEPAATTRITGLVDDARTTLAEALAARGYLTQAVVTNPWLNRGRGIEQGFAGYEILDVPQVTDLALDRLAAGRALKKMWPERFGRLERMAELLLPTRKSHANAVTSRSIAWLQEHRSDRFFLWVHYMDAHLPYNPPAQFVAETPGVEARRMAALRNADVTAIRNGRLRLKPAERTALMALYDGGIAYVDRNVGRILDTLDSLGLTDKTLVIVSADHGEEFWEHGGYEHGHALYDEVIRVPLIMAGPAPFAGGRVVDADVQLVDVMPTVLSVAGASPPGEMLGQSLVPLANDTAQGERRPTYSEALLYYSEKKTLLQDGYKLIYDPLSGQSELYDLRTDPGETRNLASTHAARAQRMKEALVSWSAGNTQLAQTLPRSSGGRARIDQETMKSIGSYGY